DGTPVAFWRHVFGSNIRDHALLRLDEQQALQRISHEQWAVDACPHHGPALAIDTDGVYHLAWFSGGDNAGLYYARSPDRGRTTTSPVRIGNPGRQAGRVALVTLGQQVVLAWKEFDGQAAVVRVMRSADSGAHWSVAQDVAQSSGSSDHPQLLEHGGRAFLAWNTANEGFRLIALSGSGLTP
ncbi:MAG: glycoside hydrolase, partial [Gammaproteobacteria bacterium]|nr:glycoside hydrolase [Gammaproteobacteria bacterium]